MFYLLLYADIKLLLFCIASTRQFLNITEPREPSIKAINFMMEELDNMKSTVRALEAKNKHLCGQDLLPLQLKELKKLEKELNTGLDRIRIRKRQVLSEHTCLLKEKCRDLKRENMHLQRKLVETDSALNNLEQGEGDKAIQGQYLRI
ncbi:hypothetical protein AMTRI_Chr06g194080 [Amborella trichopoda]